MAHSVLVVVVRIAAEGDTLCLYYNALYFGVASFGTQYIRTVPIPRDEGSGFNAAFAIIITRFNYLI